MCSGNRSNSRVLHTAQKSFLFSPSLRKDLTGKRQGKWWCLGFMTLVLSGKRVFIPPSLFSFSLVICQAAINQAFIPGIKVTFRSRFHALMLWKVEWSGGGWQIREALTWMKSWWGWRSKLESQCCCCGLCCRLWQGYSGDDQPVVQVTKIHYKRQ